MKLDELIQQITQRTGVSEDQAKSAVAITLDALKQNLPEPVAAQMSRVLAGEAFDYKDIVAYNWDQWTHDAKHKLNELGRDVKGAIDKMF